MNPELRLLDREFARRNPILVETRRAAATATAEALDDALAPTHPTIRVALKGLGLSWRTMFF